MTHGHEVLAMMQGHRNTERSLLELIIIHFGSDERFCTCSAENLTAHVDRLPEGTKPMGEGFMVDTNKV